MAISVISSVPSLAPAYNPTKYVVDSTNKNERGFRYVAQVYGTTGATAALFTKRFPPRPTDGYGEIDITKDLQAYLSKCIGFTASTTPLNGAGTSFIRYNISFGEEYVPSWPFNSVNDSLGATQTVLLQQPSTFNAPFTTGDFIIVNITAGTYPELQGVQYVNDAVIGTTAAGNYIVLDLPYSAGSTAVSGTVVSADSIKTLYAGLTSISNQVATNTALSFQDLRGYTATAYTLGTTAPGAVFSNVPRTFRMRTTQDAWLMYNIGSAATTYRVNFTNSGGESYYRQHTTGGSVYLNTHQVGLNQIGSPTVIGGATLPVIKPSTTYVDVKLTNTSNVAISETVRFVIDTKCRLEPYELLFMDAKGSFLSFSMGLRKIESVSLERQTYNAPLASYTGSVATFDAGLSNYYVGMERELTLSTDWLTPAEFAYTDEMLRSRYTYLKMEDGYYYACVITDTSYEVKTLNDLSLRKREVTLKLSVNQLVN